MFERIICITLSNFFFFRSRFTGKLIEGFWIFAEIRYVAVYDGQSVVSKERENISNSSSVDTNKYEEL